MASPDFDEAYILAMSLVTDCGEIILSAISKNKEVVQKSCDVDLVTETDLLVETILVKGLSFRFPDHKFIGEENISAGASCNLTNAPTWIIDPIDGTMNFVHGFPHCCISIALYANKVAQIGIIYNPMCNQMFTSRLGGGSFLNGSPIRVSKQTELSKALLMVEMGTSRDPEKMDVVIANVTKLTPLVHGTRSLGSAALNMAMVAMGSADADYEFGIHAWDIAAGQLLVTEAGGVCIDPAGGSFDVMSRRVLCASSMELANTMASTLIQFYPPRD